MKIKRLTAILLGMVLVCGVMASCSKDDPKDKVEGTLDGLEPLTYFDIDYEKYCQLFTHGFSFANMYWESNERHINELGYMFGYMLEPVAEYKLYTVENGELKDSGKTAAVSTADIINMFARQLNFNDKGEMTITPCTANLSHPAPEALKCSYNYKQLSIKFLDIQIFDLTSLVASPLIVTTKDLFPSEGGDGTELVWYCNARVKEDLTYCIKLGENPHAVQLLTDVVQFFIKNADTEMAFATWLPEERDGRVYCTLTPKSAVCGSFCNDVILPFLDEMSEKSEIEAFRKNVGKERINKVRTYLRGPGSNIQFMYSTSYKFSK